MGLPRSKYVQEGKEGVYHCFSRCVRRAFLYGFDSRTGRDFSHRKAWIVNRLRQLADIFAVEVCAYSIMGNHYHVILRTRPDISTSWLDKEVATRWLTLFPRNYGSKRSKKPTMEEQIRALANCSEHVEVLRKRLSSLSWFMGRLNEFIARAANKEDEVKGRFWESRFKCQVLIDEAATAACMVYVDLNPIRAGRAKTPEKSDFTSIQERIRAWGEGTTNVGSDPEGNSVDDRDLITNWLCPISSESGQRGILSMTAMEYFDLLDKSGRMIQLEKRGAIDAKLDPILMRIGANPQAWTETITGFGDKFSLVVGLVSNLRNFADYLGRRWIKGISEARIAFTLSPPRPA